jgi:peroxiredoxin
VTEQNDVREPRIPLGPDRPAFTKRTRDGMAIVLGLAVLTVIVVAVVAATTGSRKATPHVVKIPAADRSASPALLRQAEAVNFHPNILPGAGEIESRPLTGVYPAAVKSLLPVGSAAPAFTLRTPTGAPFSLAQLRGKAVLLELFATWCPHCAAEAPHLKAMYTSLPKSRYAFVGINADSEDAASVLAYHIWFGLPFPALLDPGTDPGSFHSAGSPGPVSEKYKIHFFPTFYVIDPQGKIAWSGTGEQPDALLLHELKAASQAA